jgi:hypothetical protein
VNKEASRRRSAARQASNAWQTFKDRDDWIKMMLAVDANALSCTAKIVGSRIAMHHNIETGRCDPSIGMLVSGTGMSESTVRRAIRELEEAGWAHVDRTRGRHSNSFELQTPTLSDMEGFNPVNDDSVEGANPVTIDGVEDTPTLSQVTPEPCHMWHPNPVTVDTQKRESNSEEKSEEIDSIRLDLGDEDSGRRPKGKDGDEISESFERFYQQYPRKAAKALASKAYRAVITKNLATPQELLAGAMRYAAERSGHDPKYTKHPTTWLNGGCWADEPVKPIAETIAVDGMPVRPPPNRKNASWFDAAFGGRQQ